MFVIIIIVIIIIIIDEDKVIKTILKWLMARGTTFRNQVFWIETVIKRSHESLARLKRNPSGRN